MFTQRGVRNLSPLNSYCLLACVANLSVLFWSKERRTPKVKERAKNPLKMGRVKERGGCRSILRAAKTEHPVPFLGLSLLRNHQETLATQVNCLSNRKVNQWYVKSTYHKLIDISSYFTWLSRSCILYFHSWLRNMHFIARVPGITRFSRTSWNVQFQNGGWSE